MANRIFALVFISVLLLLLDLYLFRAIKALPFKWTPRRQKNFTCLWWGYATFLILGVFISIYFNIRLTVRSILFVAFFLTVVSKLVFFLFVVIDDLRRSLLWIVKKSRFNRKKEVLKVEESETLSRS